jgi:hypothetical protein
MTLDVAEQLDHEQPLPSSGEETPDLLSHGVVDGDGTAGTRAGTGGIHHADTLVGAPVGDDAIRDEAEDSLTHTYYEWLSE